MSLKMTFSNHFVPRSHPLPSVPENSYVRHRLTIRTGCQGGYGIIRRVSWLFRRMVNADQEAKPSSGNRLDKNEFMFESSGHLYLK